MGWFEKLLDFLMSLFKPTPVPAALPEPPKEEELPMSDIGIALAFTLKNEGGFSNHPNDRGGATNFGITIGDYSTYLGRQATVEEVKNMTLDVAKRIYEKKYWKPLNLMVVKHQNVATAMFDMGVLCGISKSAQWAQEICGVTVDKKIGPVSIAAINKMDPSEFIVAFYNKCMAHFNGIVERNESQRVFLKGWSNRGARLLALANKVPPAQPVKIDDAPWMKIAMIELGVSESRNPARVTEYHGATTLPKAMHKPSVAWCSSFANWVMKKAKITGTGSAWARDWLNWGVKLSEPKYGCIVVFERNGPGGDSHVAFYEKTVGDYIWHVGGNQSNAVTEARTHKSQVLGYRWPKS